eukprot:GHVN01079552.1.p1 GENE.GHVN01079552.1~~GHVN01079552.1.p1  ORF type:complete len:390 (-),score=53.29 GHVN01079552.1:559-1728(-)
MSKPASAELMGGEGLNAGTLSSLLEASRPSSGSLGDAGVSPGASPLLSPETSRSSFRPPHSPLTASRRARLSPPLIPLSGNATLHPSVAYRPKDRVHLEYINPERAVAEAHIIEQITSLSLQCFDCDAVEDAREGEGFVLMALVKSEATKLKSPVVKGATPESKLSHCRVDIHLPQSSYGSDSSHRSSPTQGTSSTATSPQALSATLSDGYSAHPSSHQSKPVPPLNLHEIGVVCNDDGSPPKLGPTMEDPTMRDSCPPTPNRVPIDDTDCEIPQIFGFALYKVDVALSCVVIAKMAVTEKYRRIGYGRKVVKHVVEQGRKEPGIRYLSVSSLPGAVGFYKRLGLIGDPDIKPKPAEGEEYEEGQLCMEKRIAHGKKSRTPRKQPTKSR